MPDVEEVIPSARRLIKSLRDFGYDFSTAIADIVDNSIEAGATRVDIAVEFDGDESYVCIADNGKGMSDTELKEAMRYGSERIYTEEDLGKFGLGLKTASMSQCQTFYVASKANKTVVSYCWDLAHIEKTNKWEILTPKDKAILQILNDPLAEHSGTVVLWKKLDRILGFKHPYGEAARKKLNSMCRELEAYLGMVFHKFLANEVAGKPLSIYLKWNKIEPWDPFARNEENTKELSPIKIKLTHEGASGKITLQPYILPTREEFSTPDAFSHLSGPANWNQQQGFYIYRANRMIQSGGWCGLRAPDEHTKLLRVEMNFPPAFDNAFKINVAKMRVQLPLQIRDELDQTIGPIARLARDYYDGKKKKPGQQRSPAPSPNAGNPNNHSSSNGSGYSGGSGSSNFSGTQGSQQVQLFSIDDIEERMLAISTDKEKPLVINLFQRLRKSIFGKSD